MSRRPRRPLVLAGIETLEQRQMLHGGVANEPKAALLHLVDDGRDAARTAATRHQRAVAAQLSSAPEPMRIPLALVELVKRERSLS